SLHDLRPVPRPARHGMGAAEAQALAVIPSATSAPLRATGEALRAEAQRNAEKEPGVGSAGLFEKLFRLADPGTVAAAARAGQVMIVFQALLRDFARLRLLARLQKLLGQQALVLQVRRDADQFSTTG